MAYFDDPANNESWEAAMAGLRAERERRLSGEEPQTSVSLRTAAHVSAERVAVSLPEIEAEELASRGKSPGTPERQAEKRPPERQRAARL